MTHSVIGMLLLISTLVLSGSMSKELLETANFLGWISHIATTKVWSLGDVYTCDLQVLYFRISSLSSNSFWVSVNRSSV